MNVIISNKNSEILDNLSVEVIKRLDGEYSVEDIVDRLKNLFFNKMIVDITAIKNYSDMSVLQKMCSSFDMNKVILLLDSGVSRPDFISKIISLGIYNFTTNLEGIMYLYNNPNSYGDVSQYHHIDSMIVDEEPDVQAKAKPELFNFSSEGMDSSMNSVSNDVMDDVSSNITNNILDNFPGNIFNNINNDSNDISDDGEDDDDSESKFINIPESGEVKPEPVKGGTKIIGIKSVTPGAGATTLTYLMKKHLEKKYNVLAIEVEKRDFIYFNDNELISSANGVIGDLLTTNKDKNILLVDLNGSQAAENFCDEVLYLIEPSIIKINRLLSIKPKILNELREKKIILCPSMLSSKDVKDFEYESGLKVFYNMKPIDDHGDSTEVKELVVKLGYK